ncbi:MAG: LPS assembly protein LptD, partial [Bdellovibrionaceae bacterium]|nr:LPS assembly protein LptD [Pseudobdellovibrionaceae bacterium]
MKRATILSFFLQVAAILTLSICASAQTSTTPGKSQDSLMPTTMAKIGGFLISCENVTRNLETGESELSGNVQIIYKDQHFKADHVTIDQKNKRAVLDGNVVVNNTTVEIGGDHIELDYENNTSKIIKGYVKSNNIFFSGATIEQKDTNKFYVVDADYTTCNNCPATWSFDGSEINAEIGGYAFLKNSFLRISGIPIFWLPYFIVPLKNERQTGFLAPEIGFIRDRKFYFSQSIFVAISRSQDMTFTFKNYDIGGLKKQVEYRYAINNESYGEFNFAHINDSLFSSKLRYTRFMQTDQLEGKFNRWSIRGYNQYKLSPSEKFRVSLNQVSDLEYPQDFFDEFPNYADSGLENRFNYTNNSDNTSLSVNAIYYKHLLSANALSNNAPAVHQLPEFKFDSVIKEIPNTPFFYKFNLTYTNFYRDTDYDNISFQGTQGYVSNYANDPRCENTESMLGPQCNTMSDGQFSQGTDLIRTGQRLIAKGSLLTKSYSLGDVVNFSPEISYNESHYVFPVGDNRYSTKRFLEFDLLSRSKLFNVYQGDDSKYKHEFIPDISYRWIPWMQENPNQFFGMTDDGDIPVVSKNIISDTDLNNENKVQFDYQDRIYDRNLITLTLLNRVIKKNDATAAYTNIFDIQIKQSYDLYQALYGKNKNQPLSDLASLMNLYMNEVTLSNQSNYYPYLSATNSTTTVTYRNTLHQYCKIGYISKRSEEPKQDDLSLALGFVTTYINVLTGVILDTSANRQSDSRIKKVSMIAQLKPPGECWSINFFRDQKIGLEAD